MKRLAWALSVAAFIGAMHPVDASAQRTGSRIGKTATKYDVPETLALVTACMSKRQNEIARAILETLPGSEDEFRIMRRNEGAIGICMNDEKFVLDGKKLEFTARALRPSLGVAVARDLIEANAGNASVGKSDKPWFADAFAAAPDRQALDLPLLALFEMGDCLVSAEPAGATALIVSQPRTSAQGLALRKLIPHLSACVAVGQEIDITPETLRYAVAEPFIHRFESSAVTATDEAR